MAGEVKYNDPAGDYPIMRNLNKWLIVAIIAILASGMLLTLWSVQREDNLLREDLLSKTRLIQGSIGTGHVKALTGTEADLVSVDYQVLKRASDAGQVHRFPDPVCVYS